MDHAQKRRPTIAKEWQLVVLKRLQSESSNPTEGQRLAAAAETGLDEKWVRNWFTRQRSKMAARNRKDQPATTDRHQARAHSATVPTFKLQLCHLPSGPQGPPSRRSPPMPINPRPYLAISRRELPPASLHPSHRSVPTPTYPNTPSQNATLCPLTITISTYSRDPLCNRYPDFSQFFRPQVHERFRSSELLTAMNNRSHFIQLLANPNVESHASTHVQGLSNLLDPFPLGGLPTYQGSSPYLRPCPVAFPMRLVDLLGHP